MGHIRNVNICVSNKKSLTLFITAKDWAKGPQMFIKIRKEMFLYVHKMEYYSEIYSDK